MIEFPSTIRGGLPVIVQARRWAAEPSVGVGREAEIAVLWPSRHPIRFPLSRADLERLQDEALDWGEAP